MTKQSHEYLYEITTSYAFVMRRTRDDKKRCNPKGYTLAELLVAIFLTANIMGGIVLAYTAAIRYLAQAKTQSMGSAGAQIVLNLIGKELYNVACTDPNNPDCTDPEQVVTLPLLNTPDDSESRLQGLFATTTSPLREFCIRAGSGTDNTVLYCPNLTCSVCPSAASGCSGPTCQIIARKIDNLFFSRPDNTTINVKIMTEAESGTQKIAVPSREYRGSYTIAYFQ